jgi:hypothetical protein
MDWDMEREADIERPGKRRLLGGEDIVAGSCGEGRDVLKMCRVQGRAP